jgi:Protein of unknown function (DUF3224)
LTSVQLDHILATMELKGQLQVTAWQEDEIRALDDGSGKITRVSIGYRMTGDVEGESISDAVMYYRPDGTASVAGIWHLRGSMAGRRGSLVFESTGGYDGSVASSQVRVIPQSGTGDFASVRGAGTTSATSEHAEYVLELEL